MMQESCMILNSVPRLPHRWGPLVVRLSFARKGESILDLKLVSRRNCYGRLADTRTNEVEMIRVEW